MCGIVGVVRTAPLTESDRTWAARATRMLAHRGPDDERTWCGDGVAFGHRRLSIIDLEGGSQPMIDPSGRWTITYNGEIYNFREIGRTLEGRGVRFRTRSDCEVLLQAWITWGADACTRFNGMFAFAIWDAVERRLSLARDHMGVKPLMYAELDGLFVFGSELKAIATHPAVDAAIDFTALSDFLSLGYVLSPKTILKQVRKVPPATTLAWRAGRIETRQYWNLADIAAQQPSDLTFDDASHRLSQELTRSITRQRVSDVPLGSFLSGGIDSTAVTQRLAAAGGALDTFSIGFVEKTYDETAFARLAANALGTNHHEEIFQPDLQVCLPKLAWYLDEPFADTAAVPMFRLSALARRHVTVVLTGEGGDECFAGYDTYLADRLLDGYRFVPAVLHDLLIAPIARNLPSTRRKVGLDYKLKQFVAYGRSTPQRGHYSWRLLLDEADKANVWSGDVARAVAGYTPFDGFQDLFGKVAKALPLHQMMFVDMHTWLDAMLIKVDRTSMAHGLEARVPLLDPQLVEFAFSLPPSFKLRGFTTKRVLRKAVGGQIPPAIVSRRKRGFNAPVSHWIDALTPAVDEHDEWLPGLRQTWQRLTAEHHAHRRDHGYRLWALSQWSLWRRHVLNRCPVLDEVV